MQYNDGGRSAMKGEVRLNFSVAIGAAGAVGAIEQCKAGQVASVARQSTGLYRVTLNTPRPNRKVSIIAQCTSATAAASVEAYLVQGSYSQATGQFDIQVVSRAATPVAADPASGQELQVACVFARIA